MSGTPDVSGFGTPAEPDVSGFSAPVEHAERRVVGPPATPPPPPTTPDTTTNRPSDGSKDEPATSKGTTQGSGRPSSGRAGPRRQRAQQSGPESEGAARKTSIVGPAQLLDAASEAAEAADLWLSDFIRDAIDQHIDAIEPRQQPEIRSRRRRRGNTRSVSIALSGDQLAALDAVGGPLGRSWAAVQVIAASLGVDAPTN